jgi:hypothetical protein
MVAFPSENVGCAKRRARTMEDGTFQIENGVLNSRKMKRREVV